MSYINVPNVLTALRLIGALALAFAKPFSPAFYVICTLCGLTDILDGPIARAIGKASDFGARLDSVADLTFYSVMMAKLLPKLNEYLPSGLLISAAAILGVRLISYAVAAIRYRRFASLHTYLNKLTGAAVFTVPYILPTDAALPITTVICIIAGLGTLEELMIHIFAGSYDPEIHSMITLVKKKGSVRPESEK